MKHLKVMMAGIATMLLTDVAQAQVRGITKDEIIVGATVPLTGNAASIGQGWSLGARLAVEEVNAKGGIHGRKLKLILEDDGYVPARTVQNVRKMIDVDNVLAILCLSSSAGTLATIDYITETATININTLVMNAKIWEEFRPTTFTIGQGYPALAGKTAKYINAKNQNTKWGIFVQDDAFGENILTGITEAMKGSNASVVEVVKYKRGQEDFSAEMSRMKAAGVTAIYSGAVFREHVALTREAKRLGMNVSFALLFTAHSTLAQNLIGEAGQGALTSDIVTTFDEPNGKAFVALAQKLLPAKELEVINRDTMTSYAGTSVLIAALEKCGRDATKDCIVTAIENTSDFKTLAMGPVTFGKGVRFSNQKTRVLMNDFAKKAFTPVSEYE